MHARWRRACARWDTRRLQRPAQRGLYYYENIEGGHGGAADNAQRADMSALEFAFLWRCLGAQG